MYEENKSSCRQLFDNIKLVKQIFRESNNVMITTTCDQNVTNQSIFCVGKWLQQPVYFDEDGEKPIWRKDKEDKIISINGQQFMQIIETQQGLIVSFNMHEWQQIQSNRNPEQADRKKKNFIHKFLIIHSLLQTISKKKTEDQCSVYNVHRIFRQGNQQPRPSFDECRRSLNQYIDGFNQSCIILAEKKKSNDSKQDDLIFIYDKSWENGYQGQYSIFDSMRSNQQQLQLSFNRQFAQRKVDQWVRFGECYFKDILEEFIKVSASWEREAFQNFITTHEVHTYQPKQSSNLNSRIREENNKPESLKDSFFNFNLLKVFKQFHREEDEIGQSQGLQCLRNFFERYFLILNKARTEEGENILKCYTFIENILQNVELLKKYSKNRFPFTSDILECLRRHLPKELNIVQNLLSIKVQSCQHPKYYYQFEKILKQIESFKVKDQQRKRLKQKKCEVLEKLAKKLQQDSLGKNFRDTAKAISIYFELYEQKEALGFPNTSDNLKKCASLLRCIGKSELAVIIYQSLRCAYKMEEAIKEALLSIQNCKQRGRELKRYGKYFQELLEFELAKKYYQLAYEEDESLAEDVFKKKVELLKYKSEEKKKLNEQIENLRGYNKFEEPFRRQIQQLPQKTDQQADQFEVCLRKW